MINNSKQIIVRMTVTLLAIIGTFFMLRTTDQKTSHAPITIGVIQTASHPALDAARNGFVDTIKAHYGDNVAIIARNAQGSIASAHTIAQSFHARADLTAIYAIATPAAQAAASVEKQKPIIIAAVTDPQAAGLFDANTNICGSSDMADAHDTVALMHQLLPNAKTVALLYNSAEINSQVQIAALKKELLKLGLKPLDIAFTAEADVPAAVTSACQKAEALVLPNDNIISSSIQLVVELALKSKKPVIASDNLLVKHGVLAARGVDYYASGQQAAACAIDVMSNGKKPQDMNIAKPTPGAITVNKKTAAALGIVIPDELHDEVNYVE